ncbi:MAG: UDP-N-acetylglucosamine--N-acetylmuramyl-(pentapeptide) pyrophosphoryl-undecaprenol N-acetylglucosamine transferase, partial [Candidatus Solibacter sp.]|jgi:UDP-N-acetylglucosamine:LPS N-acetylglucosamine transferase
MERAGASRLVRDAEMTGEMLVATVSRIMAELARMGEAARQFAKPAAAGRAADVLEEVARA